MSKAFDTLIHDVLLDKMSFYGVNGVAKKLLKSYLTQRQQIVECNGFQSDSLEIKTGIPQGSVLGPFLFSVYINDLPLCTDMINMIMYADDTTLFCDINSIPDAEHSLNAELSKITDWLAANKLSLKLQMKVLQEAQETSLAAHVAICRERSRDILVDVGSSPAHSTGTPPSPAVVRTPLGDPPATHKAEEPETRNIPSNNPQIDDNADDLEDIRRLAVIQGRLSFTSPPQSRGRHLNNNRNGNRHHEDTRTTGTATGHLWRGRLDSHPRGNSNPNHQQNMNHHDNTNRFNHPRGGHSRHRQARDDNSVITGTSNNCSLSAAPPQK